MCSQTWSYWGHSSSKPAHTGSEDQIQVLRLMHPAFPDWTLALNPYLAILIHWPVYSFTVSLCLQCLGEAKIEPKYNSSNLADRHTRCGFPCHSWWSVVRILGADTLKIHRDWVQDPIPVEKRAVSAFAHHQLSRTLILGIDSVSESRRLFKSM